MRIDGVGSNMIQSSDTHHATDCVHQHPAEKPVNGGMQRRPVGMENMEKKEAAAEESEQQNVGGGSGWVARLLSGGKGLLGWIWTGSKDGLASAHKDSDISEIASREAAEKGLIAGTNSQAFQERSSKKQAEVNPYFVAVEDRKGAVPLWKRFKLKVQETTGQFAKRFGKNTNFQTGTGRDNRRSKEDLRRHSKYRQGQEEIECIITDDSYLLDSYDRSGKYSKLAQESKQTEQPPK